MNLIELNINFDAENKTIEIKSCDNNILLIDKDNANWDGEKIFNFLVNLVFDVEEESLFKDYQIKLKEKKTKPKIIDEDFFKKYEHIYELFEIFVDKFNEKID